MEELLGISFTNRSIVLAHTQKTEESTQLVSIHDVLYPFPFEFDFILNPKNVDLLAERIGDFLVQNELTNKTCEITLPLYMAQIKRAALPPDLDDRIVQKHLQWEVENLSAHELSQYKVVKLDHSFMFGTYQEFVFLLLQKKILESIKEIAQKTNLQITKVLLDFDTILKYLQYFDLVDGEKNQVVFQIDSFQVNTLVYLNGLFFDYSLRAVSSESDDKNFETRVMEIIQSELSRIRSVLTQLPQVSQEMQIFSTRQVTKQLQKLAQKNQLQMNVLSLTSQLNSDHFASDAIEAFAVTL